MLKTFLSTTLILLSVVAFAVPPALSKNNDNQQHSAAKIKRKIGELGLDAAVTIKLHDGRKLSGRIGEIEDDSFVLRAGLNGDRVIIAYSDVKQVKDDGSRGGANLLPGFLIAGGLILLIRLVQQY